MLTAPLRRGYGGPHDAGDYNSYCWETGFFVSQGGNWDTPYGHFFLSWYSGLLMNHADRVLAAAADVLNKHGRPRIFAACREVRAAESLKDSVTGSCSCLSCGSICVCHGRLQAPTSQPLQVLQWPTS